MSELTPLIVQFVEQLEREGVTHVFGVPGGPLTTLFGALAERRRIKYVLARHEAGAAYMANSHARVSRSLAVCWVTSGPGATNALSGVAGAYADSLPVLYLTGQVATKMFGLGAIQESTSYGVDVVEVFRPVTKCSSMVVAAEVGMRTLRHAIRTSLTGRRGPSHVNLPADLSRVPLPYDVQDPAQYRSAAVSVPPPEDLARAAALLRDARRPTIFAGNGVALSSGEDALLRLAEVLGAAVITSPKGKSVFPENHPLSLGVFGMGGHARADRYVEDDDVILVVGSSLNEFASSAWSDLLRAKVGMIHVDVDPVEIGKNYGVSLGLVGDAAATMRGLIAALDDLPPRSTAIEIAQVTSGIPRWEQAAELESVASPLSPPRLVAELRAAMPDDALLFVDTGNASLWAGHYFEARAPGTYFIDMGTAAMGSAVAGIVGGALAAPGRKAVCLTGDAAFAMHGFEVHVAVELGLPAVWVVLDNAGHGMIQQGERLAFGADHGFYGFAHRIASADVGRALGARGAEVQTVDALKGALREALAADGPTVINARIDPAIVAPTLERRARSVARFFGRGGAGGPAGAG